MASAIVDNNSKDVQHLINQLNTARNEIYNLRQQLKTLTHVHKKDCEEIQKKLINWKCLDCRNRQLEPYNFPIQSDSHNNGDLSLRYIGVIHTQFPEKRGTPRQPGICSDLIAKLTLNNDILTNPEHALEGLEEFSHMWILFHFHRNDSTHVRAKVAPPRLNGLRTGVFATRSPNRPCPIGLSLVKIDRIMENTIYFSGVDMVDQTPVIDIKPYIPQYDNPSFNVQYSDNLLLNNTSVSLQMPESSQGTAFNNDEGSDGEVNENLDNVNSRVMDGDENGSRNQSAGSAASNRRNSNSISEESFYSRSTSRIGEREAPDGEEDEDTPRQPATSAPPLTNTTPDGVRIPTWINEPRTHQLRVLFKDSVLAQLNQFGNAEADEKIRVINNVLKEDPRSVYLRHRLGNNCYVFRIASLYVSCKFNDVEHSVTVFKISQMSDGAD